MVFSSKIMTIETKTYDKKFNAHAARNAPV